MVRVVQILRRVVVVDGRLPVQHLRYRLSVRAADVDCIAGKVYVCARMRWWC